MLCSAKFAWMNLSWREHLSQVCISLYICMCRSIVLSHIHTYVFIIGMHTSDFAHVLAYMRCCLLHMCVCFVAQERYGNESTWNGANVSTDYCCKLTGSPQPRHEQTGGKKRSYSIMQEFCYDEDPEDTWSHRARLSRQALPEDGKAKSQDREKSQEKRTLAEDHFFCIAHLGPLLCVVLCTTLNYSVLLGTTLH